LCTEVAKDPQILRWADERSQKFFVPEIVHKEWGANIPLLNGKGRKKP
jgi:hypothetical protein